MKFGYECQGVGPIEAVESGVRAERSGFDYFSVPDHFVDVDGVRLEPWTVLSAMAAKTKKIMLCSGVTDTQRTHPSRTAHSVACLDNLSSGRAVLGIGAGEAMNIVPFGLPWEEPLARVARLVEAIRVIRLLWTSGANRRVSFSGRFYRLRKAFLAQSPVRRRGPRIWVGAMSGRRMLEVVGRYADGWYAWLNTPETFSWRWLVVRAAASSAGRSPREIEASSQLMVALTRGAEERRAAVLSAKLALAVEKNLLRSLGERVPEEVEQYQDAIPTQRYMRKLASAAQEIPDWTVDRVAAIGGEDEIREKIETFRKAGVTIINVSELITPSHPKRTLEIVGRVIGRLR